MLIDLTMTVRSMCADDTHDVDAYLKCLRYFIPAGGRPRGTLGDQSGEIVALHSKTFVGKQTKLLSGAH